MITDNLEPDYYQINGTKKVLYWNGNKWCLPVKDHYKRFTYIGHLDKQPTNIKTLTLVWDTEYAWQYKSITDV
jgi:hypothetical protein